MAMATLPPPTRFLSAEDFTKAHDGEYVELIDGIVVETPMPDFNHGTICSWIAYYLNQYILLRKNGRVATNDSFVKTKSNPDRVRGGDVCFLSYDRWPKGESLKGILPVVPEIIFEVRSPSDSWRSMTAKAVEYLNADVRVVVLIDPSDQSATIFRSDEKPQTIHADGAMTIPDLLPGFSLPLASLFE